MQDYKKWAPHKTVHKLSLLAIACSLLQGCGFVTAPLGQASVELMSTGLKTADYGAARGSQAAVYVGESLTAGTQWTVESLTDLRDYLVKQHTQSLREQKSSR